MRMDTDQKIGPESEGRTALYRHLDKSGRLLYVGISLDAITRLNSHMRGSSWKDDIAMVVISWFDTRDEALESEKRAITRERPLHNKNHNVSRADKQRQIEAPGCRPVILLKDRPINQIPKRAMAVVVEAIERAGDGGVPRKDVRLAASKYLTGRETEAVVDWLISSGDVIEVVKTTLRGGRPGRRLMLRDADSCDIKHPNLLMASASGSVDRVH